MLTRVKFLWGGTVKLFGGYIPPSTPGFGTLVLVILFSTVVSGSFSQHIQITSNITTSPFLPNNEVATNYPALKLMTQIENWDQYHSCLWSDGRRSLATIFSSAVPCSNRTEPSFALTCDETNKFVTTTVAFLSPVQQEDGGLYQVFCRSLDLSEVIIAQISIMVSGKSLMAFYNILYKSCFFWLSVDNSEVMLILKKETKCYTLRDRNCERRYCFCDDPDIHVCYVGSKTDTS